MVLNQALYFPELDHSLLNPNQMRLNGVIVDDCPKHLSSPDKQSTHSIYFPEQDVRIPLQMGGVISRFVTRLPTNEELEECQWLHLTGDQEWDPYSPSFAANERVMNERELGYEREPHERAIYAIMSDLRAGSLDDYADHIIIRNLSAISSSLTIEGLYDESKATIQISSKTADRIIAGVQSGPKKMEVSKEQLAGLWNIPLKAAAQTIQVTTQRGIRSSIHPLQARYRTKQPQMRYNQLGGRHGRFYSDTMFASVRSLRGNTMGQIFVNDVGIPSELLTDDARELVGGKWKQVSSDYQIRHNLAEPYSQFQNRAEGGIRELKRGVNRAMQKANAPKRLWDFCAEHQAEIRSLTATDLWQLQGRTPYEIVTGNTPDISEYTQYRWYDPVWYYNQIEMFPNDRRLIGRWLGVAHRVGQAMCYYILQSNGQVIARSTVQPLMPEERDSTMIKQQITEFDRQVQERIGKPEIVLEVEPHPSSPRMIDVDEGNFEMWEPEAAMPEADDDPPEFLDNYISAHVLLPKGDTFVKGQVVARKRDAEGFVKGKPNANPILDSR